MATKRNPKETLNIRLAANVKRKIIKRAASRDVSAALIIREALAAYFGEEASV
jgi:hypothetical protein